MKISTNLYEINGKLFIDILRKNRAIRRSLGIPNTPANVKAWVNKIVQIKVAIDQGFYFDEQFFPTATVVKTSYKSLEGFVPYWLTTLNLEKSTIRSYTSWASHWVVWHGKKRLEDITSGMIKATLNAAQLDNKSRNNAMSVLSSIYRGYIAEGNAIQNPCQGIKKWKVKRGKSINPIEDDNLVKTILYKLYDKHEMAGAYFEFCLLTGLRPSEAIVVEWKDVCTAGSVPYITIDKARVAHVDKDTKTGESRDVILTSRALAVLKRMEKWSKVANKTIFLHPLTMQAWASDKKQRTIYWNPVLKSLGLPQTQKYHPYCLRHTYACRLIKARESVLFVASQLGHADPQTTTLHYAKWLKSSNAEVLARLNAAEAEKEAQEKAA